MFCRSICLCLLLLFPVLQASAEAEGPLWGSDPMPARFDWILMTSGEWLKGDLIAMYNDTLAFDSDKMGLLSLDWADIAELRSRHPQTLRLRDGSILEGQVFINADTITIYQGTSSETFARTRLFTLASSNTNEWDFWSGTVSLGANLRTGNTQQDDYSMGFNIQRLTALTRLNNNYTGAYSSSDGSQTENNHRLNTTFDWYFSDRVYLRLTNFEFFADRFQNIDYRITYTSGVGYKLFDLKDFNWEAGTGVGWQVTYFESVEDGAESNVDTPVFNIGTELDWDITSDIEYIFQYSIQFVNNTSGEYNSHLNTGFSIDLLSDLKFSISYIWDRTENPTADQNGVIPDRDNNRLVLALGWDF